MLPALLLHTPPQAEPISLVEAKTQCRVTHAAEDALISTHIVTARRLCESLTRRSLIATVWDAVWPRFVPSEPLNLGLPQVTAVASLQHLDEAGQLQTVPGAVYALDNVAEPARLVLNPGEAWPQEDARRPNAVRARFTAGWPDAAAVPQDLRAWLLLHVQELYDRRAAFADKAMEPLPYLDTLIAPYRITRWG